jgi:hypothetical protein
MVLVGDKAQVETCLGLFTNSAWFAPYVPYAQKSFWMPPMVLLGDEAQVACLGPFADSANLDAR